MIPFGHMSSQQFGHMSSQPFGMGMVVMSIQMDSSPLDNIMSSLMSPLINSLVTSRIS